MSLDTQKLKVMYMYVYSYVYTNTYTCIGKKATTCSAKFILTICKKRYSKSLNKLTILMFDLFTLTI